jgi:hypothetical protein
MSFDAPDHYAISWPSRSTIGENQTWIIQTGTANIAGAGGTGYASIDVPAGYNMIVSAIEICWPVSCIQNMWLEIDEVVYFYHNFDISCFISFNTEGAPRVEAEGNLSIYVQNNDASTRAVRISVAGLYEEY